MRKLIVCIALIASLSGCAVYPVYEGQTYYQPATVIIDIPMVWYPHRYYYRHSR